MYHVCVGGSGSAVHEKIAHDILESICQEMTGGENVKRKRGCFLFGSMIKEVQNV